MVAHYQCLNHFGRECSSYSDPDLQVYKYEPRKVARIKEVDYQ